MALSPTNPPKNGEDMISNLPDSILIHILSLICIKHAVRTSVLSSRWKFLWTFVPNLDFTCSGNMDNNASFMNFVDRVLLFHSLPNIQRFSLDCRGEINISRLNTWVGVAIKSNVKELTVSVKSCTACQFPRSLFTCESLVDLKLQFEFQLDVPCKIHFPSLKILHLAVSSVSNELAHRLFNSCPVLENLSLNVTKDYGERTFNMCLPALKKLALQVSTNIYGEFESVFVIDAPVLECLFLSDNRMIRYELKNPWSVVEGRFWFYNPLRQGLGRRRLIDEEFLLLNAISHVKHLDLNTDVMAGLAIADDKDWPLFPNLIHLRVHVNDDSGFKSLSNLLIKVPKLESLYFANWSQSIQKKEINWYEPRGSPSYLQTCLKRIDLMVTGSQTDLSLIKYFLENAGALRKLTITCAIKNEREDKLYGKLAMFRRRSESCDIIVNDHLRIRSYEVPNFSR